jgi:hypothetical protein
LADALQTIHPVQRANSALGAAVHGATPKAPQAIAFAVIESCFAQIKSRHIQPLNRTIEGLENRGAMAKHQQQTAVMSQGH